MRLPSGELPRNILRPQLSMYARFPEMIVGSMNSSKSHVVIEGKLEQVLVSLDGRALLCATNSQQFERYPIMRIDRVSVRGNVILSSLALVALTSAGVPLAILDRSASTRAISYPFCVPQRSLAITLMRLSERSEALDIVEDWRCGEASRHARALRLNDPASSARLGWIELEKIILAAANPASKGSHRGFSLSFVALRSS